FGPFILNGDVPSFTIAERAQPIVKCRERKPVGRRIASCEPADLRHWCRRLLRARRERPSGCRAAEQCEEVAPPHGAYPKAKDRRLTIAGLGWVGGVRRNKKRRPISGPGHSLQVRPRRLVHKCPLCINADRKF